MVERNRHAFSVASVPFELVSHPVTFYRQTVRSLAVVFEKLSKGLSAMLYKFLLLGKHRLNPITINLIHHKIKHYENKSLKNNFTTQPIADYALKTVAKSTVSRGKLNNVSLANSSTPLNRAFFVRNVRTPKENALGVFLSMVGRNRQPLEVGCLPVKAVFHPVTFYRQTVESLAVTSKNLFTGVTAMLYLFKAVSRSDLRNTKKHFSLFPRYTVRINADSIEQATAQVAPFFVILEVKNA
ncbi:ash family protein [Avibacterium paragallinarum]|uniref:Ash family protein n=1 Tax=Avibacterium paragallinarum TaxID=728 RepID=A0ABU7QIK1_AVIPA